MGIFGGGRGVFYFALEGINKFCYRGRHKSEEKFQKRNKKSYKYEKKEKVEKMGTGETLISHFPSDHTTCLRNTPLYIIYIYTHFKPLYFMDQFEIDFHIFTDIKFSFNL